MNQRISDLMDGELAASDREPAWKAVVADAESRQAWETYHLIGDCLRGEAVTRSCSGGDSTARIFARLADEPTVLAPKRGAVEAIGSRTRVALAMAASVATLGVVGVIATRAPDSSLPQVAQQSVQQPVRQVANGAPVAASAPQVNDYLALHRQFVNPAGIQQATLVREAPAKSAAPNPGK